MAKTPGRPKRGKGGRFVADSEPAPEGQKAEDLADENDWSRGEGFGSVGPAAFGTPGQQASLGDLQALQAGIQDEQAKAHEGPLMRDGREPIHARWMGCATANAHRTAVS